MKLERILRIRPKRNSISLAPNIMNSLYTVLVISCFFVYFNFLKFNLFGIHFLVPESCVPYTLLYPLSYVCLRFYGYKQVNNMIISMFFSSVFFVILVRTLHGFSNYDVFIENHHILKSAPSELVAIIKSSFVMYIIGLIAMPVSIYASFLTLKLMGKFNVFTLSIATAVGEIINTYMVFPLGMMNHFSFDVIFSKVIISALLFKIVAGIILSFGVIIFLKIYE